MDFPEHERVLDVMQQGSLLLSRVERQEDRARPGPTGVRLRILNRGTRPVTVDHVTFQQEDLTVTAPLNTRVDSARYLVVVGPGTLDALALQASRQGQSALFKPPLPFDMTVSVSTPYGPIAFTLRLCWGFRTEGGYGFTLQDHPS
ncbi:hypothetical protein HNQ07_000896 [Deinococcus metalli]|uniref:Uncharacterized protein n=1 Tax=Deinococcus metalli TaxID=1141878 RepID=A0A7W8KC39_9DEIO|nr:hypothetical protein [Deinococcus metalli]MBB5375452.1 hypothetical protein [Deinococcus metalli]GHF29172.1 hypothetical protein GCM10017781_01430 [Deinococcus metalli]